MAVERGQGDAEDVHVDEGLDDFDLSFAVVFAQRAFPEDDRGERWLCKGRGRPCSRETYSSAFQMGPSG